MESEREQQALKYLHEFGLSYREIGLLFGLSKARVHQLVTGYKTPAMRSADYYRNRRAERKAAGLCGQCASRRDSGSWLCAKCKGKRAEYWRKRNGGI